MGIISQSKRWVELVPVSDSLLELLRSCHINPLLRVRTRITKTVGFLANHLLHKWVRLSPPPFLSAQEGDRCPMRHPHIPTLSWCFLGRDSCIALSCSVCMMMMCVGV